MLGKALLLSLLVANGAAASDSLTLTLNLPSYTLEVWDGPERIRSYKATIGLPKYETPTGTFQITRIEWNPSWVPPDSPWAAGKEETGPGKGNPMGRVKLQFDDYLYIHGTWQTKQLGGAFSHGCVRLSNEDVQDLARLIAERQGLLTSTEIDALERNSKRTRSVRLASAIPLRIRYDLNAEVDGEIVNYDDPYRWASPEGSPR
jgi:murein L,D-transpeptidase YcbB/YkuD